MLAAQRHYFQQPKRLLALLLSCVVAQEPATLPLITNAVELPSIDGEIFTNSYEDTWTTSYEFYMLTSVKMWKGDANTSGFEVTYSAWPPDNFVGWPDETHIFGLTDQTSHLDTVYFDSELIELQICVDSSDLPQPCGIHCDFEGFNFIEYDGDQQWLTPGCLGPWDSIDLSQDRLIGFHVTISDYTSIQNIRTIAPIVAEYPPCTTQPLIFPAVTNMVAYIALGPITQYVPTLDVSTAYGEQDGTTLCGSSSSSSSPAFSYLDYTSQTFTLQSNDPADAPSLQTITLTVFLQNDPSVQSVRTFTIELICQVQTMAITQYPSSITYNIDQGLFLPNQVIATQTPECGYVQSFTYQVKLAGIPISMPSFVPVIYQSGDQFGIDTSDPSDEDIYDVDVTVQQDDGTGTPLQDAQTFTLDIQCIIMNIVWDNEVQPFYSYTIQIDSSFRQIPTSAPFSLIQTPLCDKAESFTWTLINPAALLTTWFGLTTNPNYLTVNTGHLPNAGFYDFTLDATVSGATAQTAFQIELIDPCNLCTIITSPLVVRPLFVWQDLSNVEFSYPLYTTTIMQSNGIDCGAFVFTASSSMVAYPQSNWQDPSTWLSVDQTAQVVRMNLSFLTEAYQDKQFSLTGGLNDYPSVQAEEITTLTVYSLGCDKKEEVEQYSVGDDALTIVIEPIEQPDQALSKEVTAFQFDNQGVEQPLPDFIKFNNQALSFEIESTSNVDAGSYNLTVQFRYSDYPDAWRLCEVDLDVLPLAFNFSRNEPPYFHGVETFSPQSALCGQFWLYQLPEIKDSNPSDTVEVIFNPGAAFNFLSFDKSNNRLFILPNVTTVEHVGIYTIDLTLDDSFDQVEYSLLLYLICPVQNFTVDPFNPRYDTPFPLPYIREITQFGKVFVRFNTTMVIPFDEVLNHPDHSQSEADSDLLDRNLESIEVLPHQSNSTSFIELGEMNGLPISNFTNYSRINNETVLINDTYHHMLEVSLIDIEETALDKLNFTWECIDFTETEMVLQLYIENPSFVSSTSQTHSLRIVFIGQTPFQDTSGNVIRHMLELKRECPRQIEIGLGEDLNNDASIAAAATKFVFSGSFLLNLLFVGGLSQLLQMIQNLSFIVHLQLVNVETPANAQIFFSHLLSIVAFDVIDGLEVGDGVELEDWLQEKLGMPYTTPLTINFYALGYESTLFSLGMGSLILFFILFPVFILIVLLVRLTTQSCPRIQDKTKRMLDRTFFNSIMRFFEETYLITSLCSFINLRYSYLQGELNNFNFVLAIGALFIILGYPLFILSLLFVKIEKIQSFHFKARVGVIYEDLKIRANKLPIQWPLFITIEKLILAFVLIFSYDYAFAQLMVINFVSVAHLILLGQLQPYTQSSRNQWELFQESIVFLIFYHLFSATDFVQDISTRETVGWSMIVITSLSLLADLSRLLYQNMRNLNWYFKKLNGKAIVKKEIHRRRSTLLVEQINQFALERQKEGTINAVMMYQLQSQHSQDQGALSGKRQRQITMEQMLIEEISLDETDSRGLKLSRPQSGHKSRYTPGDFANAISKSNPHKNNHSKEAVIADSSTPVSPVRPICALSLAPPPFKQSFRQDGGFTALGPLHMLQGRGKQTQALRPPRIPQALNENKDTEEQMKAGVFQPVLINQPYEKRNEMRVKEPVRKFSLLGQPIKSIRPTVQVLSQQRRHTVNTPIKHHTGAPVRQKMVSNQVMQVRKDQLLNAAQYHDLVLPEQEHSEKMKQNLKTAGVLWTQVQEPRHLQRNKTTHHIQMPELQSAQARPHQNNQASRNKDPQLERRSRNHVNNIELGQNQKATVLWNQMPNSSNSQFL